MCGYCIESMAFEAALENSDVLESVFSPIVGLNQNASSMENFVVFTGFTLEQLIAMLSKYGAPENAYDDWLISQKLASRIIQAALTASINDHDFESAYQNCITVEHTQTWGELYRKLFLPRSNVRERLCEIFRAPKFRESLRQSLRDYPNDANSADREWPWVTFYLAIVAMSAEEPFSPLLTRVIEIDRTGDLPHFSSPELWVRRMIVEAQMASDPIRCWTWLLNTNSHPNDFVCAVVYSPADKKIQKTMNRLYNEGSREITKYACNHFPQIFISKDPESAPIQIRFPRRSIFSSRNTE